MVAIEDSWLSTSAVASSTGYSVQQVRDLEALGILAPAARGPDGYRRFSSEHVRDLGVYRDLATAVGAVRARLALRDVRRLPPDEAAALICSLHTGINRERQEALVARQVLRDIRAEAAVDAEPAPGDAMTITELASALDVRTSTLRFWEKEGLIFPDRIRTRAGTARRYPVQAARDARVVAALRSAGYRIPDVRRAVTAVRDLQDVDESLAVLDARLVAIGKRALALLRVGTALAEIIGQPRSPGN